MLNRIFVEQQYSKLFDYAQNLYYWYYIEKNAITLCANESYWIEWYKLYYFKIE